MFAILSQIWPLAMLPFFALIVQERESPDKECCHVVQPLHVDSKDENKNVNAYFFLFVLHVVCLFFTASTTLFCSPNMQDTFTNINHLLSVIRVEFHHIHC